MMDFSMMKLGRMAPHPAERSRRVMMRAVFGDELPEPAITRDWTGGATKRPTFGNLTIGDCTCATIANSIIGAVKAAYGIDFAPTEADVTTLYENFGYRPNAVLPNGDNPTDQGAVFEDVTAFVMKNGFKGHHLIGSVGVDPTNVKDVKRTIDFFGNGHFGLALPIAWQNANAWTLDGYSAGDPNWEPNSWGGHEVDSEIYNENGVWVWTWGMKIFLSYEAAAKYCDELDAPSWASWIKAGKTPAGINLEALENYATAIRQA